MESEPLFLLTSGIGPRCRTSEECEAWTRTGCIERVAQTMPGTFSELESLLAAAENGFPVILWLSKNMFIAKDNAKLLSFVRSDTKRFPDRLYCIYMTDSHDMKTMVRFEVYSSSDLDALDFLDQLGKYRDFTPRFRRIIGMIESRSYISACFLENVLRYAQAEITFVLVIFKSAHEGHAFPTYGRDVMVVFLRMPFFEA